MQTKSYKTKEKAINMYLAGIKAGTICKKFHLQKSKFEEWVEYCDVKEFRKRTAFKLHREGKSDKYICRKLSIDIKLGLGFEKLKEWIAVGYENERVKLNQYRIENQFNEYKKGRTPFITTIIKNNQLTIN